jgi:tetratricopeptide (TPR) repeat protein
MMMKMDEDKMSKEEIKDKENQLLMMVKNFTIEHINEEYEELCVNMVKKLGRKHDVPFKRGKLEIWASAVVYAIGQINFLFDKSFEPYLTPDDICNYFNTKKSTVSDKARKIRDMFNMRYYDKEFSTNVMNDNNPFNDMVVSDDGFIIPKSLLYKDEEESHTSLLKSLAEKSGVDEEIIKELLKRSFIEEQGEDYDEEELEFHMQILSNPIPKSMEDNIFDAIFNDEGSSIFNEEDDIELFEDYVIDETNPLETIEDYQRAIELFRNTKGEEYFEEHTGHFWMLHETRPFMMHLLQQAMLLWDDDQKEKAINQLQYILELNPGDNQGVRHVLINRFLESNMLKEAEDLLNFYDEEYSSIWVFSRLLLSIKNEKEKKTINKLYKEAIDLNKYVVPFLTGKKKIPTSPPGFYSTGDENEAIIYADLAFKPWNNDKIAMEILKELS